ncbi:MAG: hypothetical protein K6G38_03725 [Gammaproteobacteria bacterium]|nr:hypothetical protein [Gammaproteobacteria bacterium]
MKKEKTSLEKSHSKVSNFKLTLVAFLCAVGVAALWVGLALIKSDILYISIPLLAGGIILSIFSFMLVAKFTR